MIGFEVDTPPVPKPRMTRRDKWARRPVVLAYFAYRDEIRAAARAAGMPDQFNEVHCHFEIPMPRSWPKTKRSMLVGRPHTARPDLDNLVKGLLDALLTEDAGVARITAAKFWTDTPTGLVRVSIPTSEEPT